MPTSATYAGTTGWSGTDTSRAQAEPARHAHVQSEVMSVAARSLGDGITIKELRTIYRGLAHHGSLSSALTNLHRDGRLARLVDKRDRCHIYVLPEHVGDRTTEGPRPLGAASDDQARLNELARQEGHDLGWQEGYERGRQEAADALIQHIDAMRAALGPSVAAHHDRCWHKHVACALTRVRADATRLRGAP